MNDTTIVQRLRQFLFGLAGFMCAGTIVELLLAKHFDEPMQIVPFVLCAAGLVIVLLAWKRPSRAILQALRAIMALLTIGSLIGVYEHIAGNLEVVREVQPNAATSTVLLKTLTGAAPLLAPGILALVALLAIAATYYHPVLTSNTGTAQPRFGTRQPRKEIQ